MAVWNTLDEIEERRAYNEIFRHTYCTYYTWERERQEIHSKTQKEGINSRKSSGEEISYLFWQRDSIQFRMELAQQAMNNTQTDIVRRIVTVLRREMEDVLQEIAGALQSLDGNAAYQMDGMDIDKSESKNIFILQVLNQLGVLINNADEISVADMKVITKDIHTLILWYQDTNINSNIRRYLKEDLNYERIADFYASETKKQSIICNSCGKSTTTFYRKCLCCGKTI